MSDPIAYVALRDPASGHANSDVTAASESAPQSPPSTFADDEPAAATAFAPILGNGVNLQPSYYYGGDVDLGWVLMQENPKIKSVRFEIEPGQEISAQRWIREAAGCGYTIVATYHKYSALGSDVKNDLLEAAAWWVANYGALRAEGRLTVNLMNEWGSHGISAAEFAGAYNEALARVREVYDGDVIIDIPGFGQEAQIAIDAIKGPDDETITDPNIILSAHIYPDAWNNYEGRGLTTSDIDTLTATGLDCLIGEFGDNGHRGSTDWAMLVNYAKTVGWPVLGWAWNGDGGNMNMISPGFQRLVVGTPQQYSRTDYFDTVYRSL